MLFCLDFDHTMVKGHFHNALMKSKLSKDDPQFLPYIEELLNDNTVGLKNGPEMKRFIQEGLKNGHKFAITSYTMFPEAFNPALRRMGLTEDEITQIPQVAFLPMDQRVGKAGHMAQAMEQTGIEDKTKVYLIDDSSNNCRVAKKGGFKVVEVDDDLNAPPDYLTDVTSIAMQLSV